MSTANLNIHCAETVAFIETKRKIICVLRFRIALYQILTQMSTNLRLIKQALSTLKAPDLCLFIIAAIEQVGKAACDVIHFSLFRRIVGMTVYIKSCKEVSMSGIVLYLFH